MPDMTVSFSHADGRHIPGFPGCLFHKSTERGKEIRQNMAKRKKKHAGFEVW